MYAHLKETKVLQLQNKCRKYLNIIESNNDKIFF